MQLILTPITLTFRIEGRVSMRVRRQIGLAVFRALRPAFPAIEYALVHHRDGHWRNIWRDSEIPTNERQALSVQSPPQKLGFVIRMRRLALGLTQRDLARRVPMDVTHLSQVEHGRCFPRQATLRKIGDALRGAVVDKETD